MAKRPKYGGRRAGTRNKATREVKDLALPYTAAAMKELGRLALKAESEPARVAAIKELFDRAFGKASQAVTHSGAIGTFDLTGLSDDEFEALGPVLRKITDNDAGVGS